jgi:hypothetical protein
MRFASAKKCRSLMPLIFRYDPNRNSVPSGYAAIRLNEYLVPRKARTAEPTVHNKTEVSAPESVAGALCRDGIRCISQPRDPREKCARFPVIRPRHRAAMLFNGDGLLLRARECGRRTSAEAMHFSGASWHHAPTWIPIRCSGHGVGNAPFS